MIASRRALALLATSSSLCLAFGLGACSKASRGDDLAGAAPGVQAPTQTQANEPSVRDADRSGTSISGAGSPAPASTTTMMAAAGPRAPTRTAEALAAPLAEIAKHIEIVQAGEVPGEVDDPAHATENAHGFRPSLEGTPGDGQPKWRCRDDRAFRASSPLVFQAPTAPELIAPLTEATRLASKSEPPFSLVFQHRSAGGEFLAALSATRAGGDGKHAFFAGKVPSAAPLILAFGDEPAVTTERSLPTGFLRVTRGDRATGPLASPAFLELRRILWRASPTGDPTKPHGCDELTLDVHALLPLSQLDVALPVAGGQKTIAEILQLFPPAGGFDEEGLPDDIRVRGHLPPPPAIHFQFKATAAAFDATSFPGVAGGVTR
jgi:hypothetical protein